ncbi:MAG: hypothetical protein H7070_06850 [Saprospiraceae bacterium]|nr:hypothetical protein [Pyrinomonadaceae bacterium]
MNLKIISTALIILTSALLAACGDAAVTTNNNAPNANTAKLNTNTDPLAVSTPAPEAVTNNAPTLTPVYKSYCSAMVKRDEAALRKIYSTDTIKYFEAEMKADGVKSLTEYLSTDQASNELCEVVNEQITGDNAVAKIKSKGYPNGIDVVFVKEGGEWKLTNKSPSVDGMKQSATNSNTGK